jgi:hypothetical protein
VPYSEPEPDPFSFKLTASGGVRLLWDSPIYMFEADLAFGAKLRRRDWYFYGALGFSRGETQFGLDIYRWWLGGSFEHAFDVIRLGAMPQLSMLVVDRITESGDTLAAFCIGADLSGSVDLVRGEEHHALFLQLRLGAAVVVLEAPYWGGTLGLGYRY